MTTSPAPEAASASRSSSLLLPRLKYWGIPVLLVLVSALFKTMPYLINRFGWDIAANDEFAWIWGFSPLLPLAVVLGASRTPLMAVLLASAAWLLGDLGIWAASGVFEYAFYRGQPLVLMSMWLVVLSGYVGTAWTNSESPLSWRMTVNTGSGLCGAVLFFLVSNFLVWLMGGEMMYAKTLGGLIECYLMALPFHKYDLPCMLVFVPALTVIMPLKLPRRGLVSEHLAVPTES